MSWASTLPKRLQPMLATLTDGPFDDPRWAFEDKYDGFRMVAKISDGKASAHADAGATETAAVVDCPRPRVRTALCMANAAGLGFA
jgi:bifunctional non-homologous end joining protein LigD